MLQKVGLECRVVSHAGSILHINIARCLQNVVFPIEMVSDDGLYSFLLGETREIYIPGETARDFTSVPWNPTSITRHMIFLIRWHDHGFLLCYHKAVFPIKSTSYCNINWTSSSKEIIFVFTWEFIAAFGLVKSCSQRHMGRHKNLITWPRVLSIFPLKL